MLRAAFLVFRFNFFIITLRWLSFSPCCCGGSSGGRTTNNLSSLPKRINLGCCGAGRQAERRSAEKRTARRAGAYRVQIERGLPDYATQFRLPAGSRQAAHRALFLQAGRQVYSPLFGLARRRISAFNTERCGETIEHMASSRAFLSARGRQAAAERWQHRRCWIISAGRHATRVPQWAQKETYSMVEGFPIAARKIPSSASL